MEQKCVVLACAISIDLDFLTATCPSQWKWRRQGPQTLADTAEGGGSLCPFSCPSPAAVAAALLLMQEEEEEEEEEEERTFRG